MMRTWKKIILKLENDSYREDLYEWFHDQNPYGFWEKNGEIIIAYVRKWPDKPYPKYVIEALYEEESDENWAEDWRKKIKTVIVDDKITIRPPWEPPSSSPIDLTIYPAYAFGTGDHPTTFSCMKCMNRYLKPGMSFLDVGTGTGILSLLAVHLGAGKVTAIDTDLLAIEELKRNCHLNQIPSERLGPKNVGIEGVCDHFDFIVANIGAQFFLENLSVLNEKLKISGYMVLSGFQSHDLSLIETITRSIPLYLIKMEIKDEWVTQVYLKKE